MRTRYLNHLYRGSVRNPFQSGLEVGARYSDVQQFESALVVDVITNDAHPDYSPDGYNIGVIKFRFLDSQELRPEESLNLAFPLDSNLTRYPLLNELVTIFKALNRYYYMPSINVSNRPTSQAIFGIKKETDPLPSSGQRSEDYNQNANGGAPQKDDSSASEEKLGNQFVDLTEVFRIRPQEGDVILEGRSGHSIRLGSNFDKNQAPNLLIRVGPNPVPEKSVTESPYAVVDEDINKDLSSIWIVADQVIPLDFATVGNEAHFKTADPKPSTLDGNQMIINTDRLVINTKRDKLLVSTFLGTHFATLQDHTVDAGKNYRSFAGVNREIEAKQNYLITIGKDYLLKVGGDKSSHVTGKTQHVSDKTHAIVGSKIFIGSLSDESEPQVLGEQLRTLLLDFVNAHLDNAPTYTVPTIGIGPLSPAVISALQQIKQKLTGAKAAPFESKNNFVTKTNSAQ